MTLGKDVSGLFTAVVNCMMTPHLEVRKLVYLYLINYAKTQVSTSRLVRPASPRSDSTVAA